METPRPMAELFYLEELLDFEPHGVSTRTMKNYQAASLSSVVSSHENRHCLAPSSAEYQLRCFQQQGFCKQPILREFPYYTK